MIWLGLGKERSGDGNCKGERQGGRLLEEEQKLRFGEIEGVLL